MTVNAASRRVMEKARLRYVRTFPVEWSFKVPGEEQGGVEYAIDRTQWAKDRVASFVVNSSSSLRPDGAPAHRGRTFAYSSRRAAQSLSASELRSCSSTFSGSD